MKTVNSTIALCPTCLRELDANVFVDEHNEVWMERTCPEHGHVSSRVWPDVDHYKWITSIKFPKQSPLDTCSGADASKPCPFGCGVCSRHTRKGTLQEIEVTQACNLHCPVCFMSAENNKNDPSLDEISSMLDSIFLTGGAEAGIQITGGEPTVREDLVDIIALCKEKGFWGIEVNTNGVVIAKDEGYLEKLVEAGLTGIYLSFDSLRRDVYKTMKGADLLDMKLKAIQRCREAGIQVVLATTIVSGINEHDVFDIVNFCMENSDIIAGLALQPAFTSGRFETKRANTYTMGDVILDLAKDSQGVFQDHDFLPLASSDPLCAAGTFILPNKEALGGIYPATRDLDMDEYLNSYSPDSPQGSVFIDLLNAKGVDLSGGLSIIIMDYMDAYTMDINRLRGCSMMVSIPDGRTIPFCAYHLTDNSGCRVYAPWGKEELRRDPE